MNLKYKRYFDKYYSPLITLEKLPELKKFLTASAVPQASKNNRIKSELLEWIIKSEDVNENAKKIINDELLRRQEFLNALQLKFKLLSDKKSVIDFFDTNVKKFNFILYALKENQRYNTFEIFKKRGGKRIISSPVPILKKWQSKLNIVLSSFYHTKYVVHGFAKNRSIATNAAKHINKKFVINVDIKDFFPSINFGRVRGLFLAKPFNFNEEVATILAQLCCLEGCLPQGAPTSPILTNLVCSRLDQSLMKLAQKRFCTFTRYADDITFSTRKRFNYNELLDEIKIIINKEGFELNENKIRIQNQNMRQVVTGLTVNEKVNINRKYIRKVRAILNSWEKKGYVDAAKQYYRSFDRNRLLKPKFAQSVLGKIEFIGSIKTREHPVYQKLLDHFNRLSLDLPRDPVISASETVSIKDKVKPIQIESNLGKSNGGNEKKMLSKSEFKQKLEAKDRKLPHDPPGLVKQLSKFTDINYNLKKLVHSSTDNEEFDLEKILESAKLELDGMKDSLPSFFINYVNKELFDLYEKEGLKIWRSNNKIASPINLDKKFEDSINTFKKRYRFGKNKVDSTNLFELIQKLLAENKLNCLIGNVEISEELGAANFSTDVEGIKIGLRIIFDNIVQKLDNAKKVCIKFRCDYTEIGRPAVNFLEIEHLGSFASLSPDNFLHKLNNSEGEFSEAKMDRLKSRCDWYIQSKFQDGKYYELRVLDKEFPSAESKYYEISPLQENMFKHILIFY